MAVQAGLGFPLLVEVNDSVRDNVHFLFSLSWSILCASLLVRYLLSRRKTCGSNAECGSPAEVDTGAVASQLNVDPELCLIRPDEVDVLARLKHELADSLLSMPQWEDVVGERKLLRFIRGHGGTSAAAAKAYRDFIAWRTDNGVDAIRRSVDDMLWSTVPFEGWGRICSVLPMDIDAGRTPFGHIVWIEKAGALDLNKIQIIPENELRHSLLSMLELRSKALDEMSVAQGRLIKCVQLRDLKGLGPKFFASVVRNGKLVLRLKEIVKASLSGHPETIEKIVMLNVPGAFYMLWNVIKPLLTERAKAKCMFLPSPYDAQTVWHVAGADALVALTRLLYPGSAGQGRLQVAAGDFLDVALHVPDGDALEWSWQGGDLEFSLTVFPVARGPALRPEARVSPGRCCSRQGRVQGGGARVCFFRWSNAHSWSAAKEVSWAVRSMPSAKVVGVKSKRRVDTEQLRHRSGCSCFGLF